MHYLEQCLAPHELPCGILWWCAMTACAAECSSRGKCYYSTFTHVKSRTREFKSPACSHVAKKWESLDQLISTRFSYLPLGTAMTKAITILLPSMCWH